MVGSNGGGRFLLLFYACSFSLTFFFFLHFPYLKVWTGWRSKRQCTACSSALQSLCGGPGAKPVLNDAASLGEVSSLCPGVLGSGLCAGFEKTAAAWRWLFQHAGKLS